MTQEITPDASFTLLEEQVRRFWRRNSVPEEFLAKHRGGSPRTIALQPLMAAGRPPGELVGLLATADLFVRYQAMRGWPARRLSGWICHGLPVELEVERALDTDLSRYDISTFGAACREAAVKGVQEGEALAGRIAVWPAQDDPFISLEPQNIGMVWSALRRLWDGGHLKRRRRIVSVCPRCATPLSSSEASLLTGPVRQRSAWVRLPWDGEPDTYLLIWLPAPWMLVGMVALAAHPGAEYVLVQVPAAEEPDHDQASPRSTRLLMAHAALKRAISGDYRVLRRMSGRSLGGARYRPPFTFLPAGSGAGQVLLSEEVALEQGTGLMPVTPAFDAPSLDLAQRHRLPVPEMLDDWGAFGEAVTAWRGLSPLDAEPLLIEDLQARGLLVDEHLSDGERALCPHCATPLLPLARSVWALEFPGDPWVVSRDRVWGVPLPVWECAQCNHALCVAGLDDLAQRAAIDVDQIDPHRPAVDRLVFLCERCGGTMRRVAAVLDVSLESAVLSSAGLSPQGPASLAIGLGDERVGWLGDFAKAVALLREGPAWEQFLAIPQGGPEASWDPERHPPADALRWAAYTQTTPEQAERDFMRPLWRLVIGLLESSEVQNSMPGTATAKLLDRWLAARLHYAVSTIAQALDGREPRRAASELAVLVSDLAAWYQPLRPGAGREVLEPLSLLLAPFVPHLAEATRRQAEGRPCPSVHLEAWPVPDPAWEDGVLLSNMDRVRRLVALGLRARAMAGIEPDQLLPGALVGLPPGASWVLEDLHPFTRLLADTLRVTQVKLAPDAAAYVRWRLAPNPERPVQRALSPAALEAALADLGDDEAAHLATQLRKGLSVGLEVSGTAITLLSDEVSVSVEARSGSAVAADSDHLVILAVG